MKLISDITVLRKIISEAKKNDKKIGFVPTMGALHEGHLKLVKEAKKKSNFIVVSIFVNPKQFGENEDLDRYPRDLDGDSNKLNKEGVDIIFFPKEADIYPENYQTTVSLSKISKGLCGDKREGHFDGVSTVVLKLFNIVSPDFAFFGLKDYQQFCLIEQMVKDLNLATEVIGVDILRESDGLAMSSRNLNLTKTGRESAKHINLVLKKSINNFHDKVKGFANSDFIIDFINSELSKKGFIIDYIEIRDKNSLELETKITENSMVFIATFMDNVRLIDNFSFREKYL